MSLLAFGTNDFAMLVPEEWRRKAVLSFVAPGQARVPQSIVLTQDTIAEPCTLERYASDQMEQLKELLGEFRLTHESTLMIQGQAAPMLAFTWKPQASPTVVQLQVYLLKFPQVWTITGTTAAGQEDSFRPLFEQVALSFTNQLPGDV